MLDKAGLERGGCCMSMTLRDYARIGLFMLGGGKIDGKSILPDGWVEDATTNQLPKTRTRARAMAISGGRWMRRLSARSGSIGQGICVYPEENLVIAVNSAMPKATDRTQSQKPRRRWSRPSATAANGGCQRHARA